MPNPIDHEYRFDRMPLSRGRCRLYCRTFSFSGEPFMLSPFRTLLAGALLASSAPLALAQSSTWKIDPNHSAAGFTVRHMGISNVHGRFGGVTGEIVLDPADLSKSSVKATIDTTTVDTGVAARDTDLKSDHFFDAAKYPTMTFVSKSVTKNGDGYTVTGDLTMHGVNRQVVLAMDAPSKELAMEKQTRRGFDATTTIHRQDFGLNYGGTLKTGDAMIGNDVKVTLEVEATKE
jgi:polyisoprenoid-binding protein YceI